MSTVLTDRMQIMSTSKSRSYRRLGRVALVNTSDYSRQRSSMAGALPLTVQQSRRRSQLREVPELVIPANDRRLYNPDPVLTYKRLSGRPARVVAPSPKSRAKTLSGHPVALLSPSTLLFQNPSGVSECVKRGIRREVIHAQGVAGSKVSRPKKPVSKVRC